MNVRHLVVAVSALTMLTASAASGDGAPGPATAESRPGPGLPETPALGAVRGALPADTIRGFDGEVYPTAPPVITGRKGDMYFGFELDYVCALGGAELDRSMDRMGKFAKLLQRHGRTVVWTVAPGKTWGVTEHLRLGRLPHGSCDAVGIRQQNAVLDARRPAYLPLRPLLVGKKRQMYFKTDPHWTTVGGAAYARAVAARLDPRLGRKQRYSYSTETRWGGLSQAVGDPTEEVGERAVPANGVVVEQRGDDPTWVYPTVVFDHTWRSRPARKTWPGHTLLLGDSFMYFALENMRPVFRHGRFLWLGHTSLDEVVDSIVASDTVVLEAYAAFGSIFGTPGFRRQVRDALVEADAS